jgi:hypothetical protein
MRNTITLKIRGRAYSATDFAEAGAVYRKAWDAELSRGGCIRGAEIFNDAGELIARVSQNGRIWPPEPWHPDQQPLWDNRPADFSYDDYRAVAGKAAA